MSSKVRKSRRRIPFSFCWNDLIFISGEGSCKPEATCCIAEGSHVSWNDTRQSLRVSSRAGPDGTGGAAKSGEMNVDLLVRPKSHPPTE